MKTIILHGMCYAGKTTLSKMVGEILQMPFIDSKDLFINEYGISETQYLKLHGRDKFKIAEKKSLQQNFDGKVLSLGGSAIYYPEEMQDLYNNYTIVWLKVPFKVIEQRKISEGIERPVIYPDGINTFEELNFYLFIHY